MPSNTFPQIWKRMDQERRRQAATALLNSAETAGEQRQIAGLIAKKLNLRPQKAAKLPPEKASAYLSTIGEVDDFLAASLVRSYLFAHQKPMLVMFLEELKIPHQDGLIPEGNTVVPTADMLRTALERIRAAFAPEDVQLYVSALSANDAVTWANLEAALKV